MKKLTQEKFIQKAKTVHGDKYDYSKVVYINARNNILITCSKHGDFEQIAFNHLKGSNCSKCNKENLSEILKINNKDFIEKAKLVHGDRYNYSEVIYQHSQIKVSIICPMHGEFEQTPSNHLQGQGCPVCKSNQIGDKFRSNIDEFIIKANKIHNNKYLYLENNYINALTKIKIKCKKHGEFYQTPSAHLQGQGCPICKASRGELAIKTILNKHKIKAKPQYRLPDEKYLLKYDFYLPELNILIEFHGRQHYEHRTFFHKTLEDFKESQKRDNFKKSLAWEKKIPLLEFNYKQFIHMSEEEFENFVINSIQVVMKRRK